MVMRTDFSFPSSDGIHTVRACAWLPEGNRPRGARPDRPRPSRANRPKPKAKADPYAHSRPVKKGKGSFRKKDTR